MHTDDSLGACRFEVSAHQTKEQFDFFGTNFVTFDSFAVKRSDVINYDQGYSTVSACSPGGRMQHYMRNRLTEGGWTLSILPPPLRYL